MTARTTYHRRKDAGQCVHCGGTPEQGRPSCRPCADRYRQMAKESHERNGDYTRGRNKRAGLCECGATPEQGFKACATCRKASTEKQKRYAARKKGAGLCPCGGKLAGGERNCPACRKRNRARQAERKAAGVCMACPSPAAPDRVHCTPCLASLNRKHKRRAQEAKRQVFDHYGRSCKCCGCDFQDFLSIDHVGGGGTKHRESLGGKSGTNFYRWLVRQGFPDGYQTLCHSCNMAKGFYGRCRCQDWTPERTRSSAGTLGVF